jgi:hypothetical protein
LNEQEGKFPQMKWLRRFSWAVTGIAWFLWIGFEDQGLSTVIFIAALWALVLGVEVFLRWGKHAATSRWRRFLRTTLVGGLAGAGVAPLAMLLALLKISLHGHSTPDFRLGDFQVLLAKISTWMVVGLLAGMGGGFWMLAREESDEGKSEI